MTKPLDSFTPEADGPDKPQRSAWIKVSAVAAVSALAGGLAAAWFYRNTLKRLQHAESEPSDSNFGISAETSDDQG